MAPWTPGPRNGLTDVAGLLVGQAEDQRLASGTTVVLCEEPATAAVHVSGGAPGSRETDLLAPEATVQAVDALVLSGGSAFGLDAAAGVQAFLREKGRGFQVGPHRVPIVPAAILFDLSAGGGESWERYPPYRDLGYAAAGTASLDFALGTHGAGTGASTVGVKGGIGSASVVLASGITVAALVAVNALGSPLVGGTRHFWAAPFEIGGEFGGLGLPHPWPADAVLPRTKAGPAARANTTIAVLATDAVLDKAGAKRLAVAAHDGFARALWPAHTDYDGDLVFALATGRAKRTPTGPDRIEMGAAAAAVMARAIARGVFSATSMAGDRVPAWSAL
ncbi:MULTISPECIES: P1 family peptidase [unclassified Aureimonas]|uniref:P1 family peptidase n=1 Tax=unclassified Aureimonas TaxID=2615206 RepID=UPI0006F62E1A|nr:MULTISPECIES: P1 family peptidase [unclassified Aureimonas]KQT57445.1 peptidase T4 [Aureimonas sp. Leaf427]KQT77124.1 peptidase T4 [Aureimonas sp. Leaf460]